MTRSGLYILTISGLAAGYSWIGYHHLQHVKGNTGNMQLCLMKRLTGIPCPSCGSTRAAGEMFNGNFSLAFSLNPLGFITGLLMLIIPVWLLSDLIRRKPGFFLAYQKAEILLKKNKFISVLLLLFVAVIWIRNIYNGV